MTYTDALARILALVIAARMNTSSPEEISRVVAAMVSKRKRIDLYSLWIAADSLDTPLEKEMVN